MNGITDFQTALLRADPQLSKFTPLPRILSFNDFDNGANGWCELIGNYDTDIGQVPALKRDLRPPQLSNLTFFDIGTHGSMDGTYALKLATRPVRKHFAIAIKRLTWAKASRVQFEMYFTYKAEHTKWRIPGAREWDGNFHPTETHFGDITISNDVMGPDGERFLLGLRYLNADEDGKLLRKWVYKTSVHPTTKLQVSGQVPNASDHNTVSPDDWLDVPDGAQEMCFNEVPTKINWHYLRWLFDVQERRNIELQVNDKIMDLRDLPVPLYDHRYESIENILNIVLDVRTHVPVRNMLFVDSSLISVDY